MSPVQPTPHIVIPSHAESPLTLSPSLSISTSTSTSTSGFTSSPSPSGSIDDSVRIRKQREGSMASVEEDKNPRKNSFNFASLHLPRPAVLTHHSSGSITTTTTCDPVTPITPHNAEEDRVGNVSPTASVASTAKDGLTPRAELSQPIWPLTMTKASDIPKRKTRLSEEPAEIEESSSSRSNSLKRGGSWKKKHSR